MGTRGVWSPPLRGALFQGVPGIPMLVLRDVQKSDLAGLKRLAAVLNTVNLPNNEETLSAIIDKSVKSFAGKVKNPLEREYLFVLEDPRNETIIGTSMIIAQHGTYEAPAHLLRGERARALLGLARAAPPAQGALHRVQLRGPHGDRRAGGGPALPRHAGQARQAAVVRALPLHRHAPAAVPAPGAGGAAAAAAAGRAQPAVGGVRPEVHRARATRRRTGSAGRTRSSSRSCSPPRTSTPRCSRRGCRRCWARWGRRRAACSACWSASASGTWSASIRSTAGRTSRPTSRTSPWCAATAR